MILATTANLALGAIVITTVIGMLTWAILTSRPQPLSSSMKSIGIRQPHTRRHGVSSDNAMA